MDIECLNIVLVHPEIAPNTGAIGRTCVGVGAALWLVRPMGFQINDRHLKRAGLDYWAHLDWRIVENLEEIVEHFGWDRLWFFSAQGGRPYTSLDYRPGDALIFGSESRGLPPEWRARAQAAGRAVSIPMRPEARGLNLSNAVAVAAFEAIRQFRERGVADRSSSQVGEVLDAPFDERC